MDYLKLDSLKLKKRLQEDPFSHLCLRISQFHEEQYSEITSHRAAALAFIERLNTERGFPTTPFVDVSAEELNALDWSPETETFQNNCPFSINPRLMRVEKQLPYRFFSISFPFYARFNYSLYLYFTNWNEQFFVDFHEEFFPDKDQLAIYRWNTDWSNYFKAIEWIADPFFCTIYDHRTSRMSVICTELAEEEPHPLADIKTFVSEHVFFSEEGEGF